MTYYRRSTTKKLAHGRRIIKFSISLIFWLSDRLFNSLLHIIGKKYPIRTVVLYYHSVTAAERSKFGKQMELLLRLARPVSTAASERIPGNRYLVAVTFDDGFVSVLENALPELELRNIPVTLFVPTGSMGMKPPWINSGESFAGDEEIITERMLGQLPRNELITIGSHSVTHPNFLMIDEQSVWKELTESKARLEMILGRTIELFSFPHGAYNDRHVELARKAGYRRVFTITPCIAFEERDEYVTGRVKADLSDWNLEVFLKVRGAYRWMTWWSHFKERLTTRSLPDKSVSRL